MRNLLLLLRYGMRGSSLVLSKKGGKVSSVLPVIFSIVVFGLPIYFVEYNTFSVPMPKAAYEILAGLWSLMMSLITLTSTIPSILYSITGADEKELLSILPIKDETVRSYLTLLSLFTNPMMPVAYVMGLMGIYHGRGLSLVLALVNGLSHVAFLVSLSAVIAYLLSWKVKATRRLYLYSFMLNVILLVLVIQINPATVGSPVGMAKKLLKISPILTWKYSPFFWPVSSYPCKSIALAAFLTILSGYIPMGEVQRSGKKTPGRIRSKEMILFSRKEQNTFFLLYPLIFSVLYGYFFKSDTAMYILHLSFSAFYSSVSAASLIQEELLTYPIFKTLPVEEKKMVLRKLGVVSLMYSIGAAVVFSFGVARGIGSSDLLYAVSFPTVLMCSAGVGMLEAVRNPDYSRGKVLSGKGLLKVETVGVGIALLSFAVPAGVFDRIIDIPRWLKIISLLSSTAAGISIGVGGTMRAAKGLESFEA